MVDSPTQRSLHPLEKGSVLLTFGGMAAAFGAASCCALPLFLTTAGIGTAWLTGIALLAAPYRPILLIGGAVSLAGGAVLFWRQQRVATCTPNAFCTRPVVSGLTFTGLLVGVALLYLGYAYG